VRRLNESEESTREREEVAGHGGDRDEISGLDMMGNWCFHMRP
jgi:hypothetical protein